MKFSEKDVFSDSRGNLFIFVYDGHDGYIRAWEDVNGLFYVGKGSRVSWQEYEIDREISRGNWKIAKNYYLDKFSKAL